MKREIWYMEARYKIFNLLFELRMPTQKFKFFI